MHTQNIIATCVATTSEGTLGSLGKLTTIKRLIQRNRPNKHDRNPKSVHEFIIPLSLTKTIDGQSFLLFDSGKEDDDRMLIFGTERNLKYMESCPHWYTDGTFKAAPAIFEQLYTIHGAPHTNLVPTVYALLTKKSTLIYIKLIQKLKELNTNLKPVSIMMDFEQAAIAAFKMEFPGVTIRGCFFHLSQCIWRKVQSTGIKQIIHYKIIIQFQV